MEEDPLFILCPACGSALTAPLGPGGMWECRYHLCRVIFPLHASRSRGQCPLLAEEEPPYTISPEKE
jgi:hypothetical protein